MNESFQELFLKNDSNLIKLERKANLKDKLILLVDDSYFNLEALKAILST
jgi:PleD family two-component response regulator